MSNLRVLLMPRWGGTPDDDWYPFVQKQFGGALDFKVIPLPNKDAPTIDACVATIAEAVGDQSTLPEVIFVGHSVGAQAMLRYLATLPKDAPKAHSLLAVAGWFKLDKVMDGMEPWLETAIDTDTVKANVERIGLLISDDDPYTADHKANGAEWSERLGADVNLVSGAGHFTGKMESAVINEFLQLL